MESHGGDLREHKTMINDLERRVSHLETGMAEVIPRLSSIETKLDLALSAWKEGR